jgi:integrin alpha FG-GAP repeat containing protein 1
MRFPHSNAFINLDHYNSDLTADIFISGAQTMEYWHNDKGFGKLEMVLHCYPPNKYKHLGQSAFVDINTDGLIDHILAVCSNEFNSNDNECKDPQILGYHLDDKQWIPISDINIGNQSALTFAEVSVFGQKLPITLRHGDIDGDGYSDLITVMKDNKNQLKAVVLKNTKADNKLNRKFVVDWTSDKALGTEVNVEIAAFVDLFEDGKIDILMTTKDKSGKRSVEAVLNTEMVAACFLKVLVTSGLCYGSNCPRGNIPYGTNQAGPFVCYQLQDLDGNMQTGCAGQLSQSSHFALQMPYSVFGLGETPNFVETLSASIPSGAMKPRDAKWTQIVPDAQVVLIPFPPNDTSSWVSKLFYTPSNIVFSTLITLASICCILVLIIGILHRKELLEDLAEHEEYKRHWPESR